MNTYLLAWNPSKYPWDDFQAELRAFSRGELESLTWSVGSRSIARGDRLFLIRLGVEPRGIVASGWALGEPYPGPHWDEQRAEAGDEAWYIDFMLDFFAEDPLVPMAMLKQDELADYHWSTQMSGVKIPEPVAAALEQKWADVIGSGAVRHLDEYESDETFSEGALVQVLVSRHERSPQARQACLALYGPVCSVCEMTFADRYGPQAYGFMEVHHLDPIHAAGGEHEVSPEHDLRPVCPNCHRFIHLSSPPLTIEQARQAFLKNHESGMSS